MSTQLQEQIHSFTTDFLLEQLHRHSAVYTEEALQIMKDELNRRDINPDNRNATHAQAAPAEQTDIRHAPEDFIKLETPFNPCALTAALSLMQEQSIPCMLGRAPAMDALPGTEGALVLIHKDSFERAQALIASLFSIENGFYSLTFNSPVEQLRAFNFYEIKLSDKVLSEELEVSLTKEEKRHLCAYGTKLLEEADRIEQDQDRMLFYYDSIEPLINKINANAVTYTRADLLTILEIIQVYCTDEQFPSDLITSGSGIVELFT